MRALLTLLFVGGLLAPAAGARAQPVVDAPEPGDDGAADAETPEPGAPGEAGSPPPPLVAPPEDQAPSPAEEEARLLDRAVLGLCEGSGRDISAREEP